jgi:hypothetical protein
MVTFVVVIYPGQGGDGEIVYVTTYTPAVLDAGVIAPVDGSMVKPAVDVYVPPAAPVRVTLVEEGLEVHMAG